MNNSKWIDPQTFDFKKTLNHFNKDMIEILTSPGHGKSKIFVNCDYHKNDKRIISGNLDRVAYHIVSSGILDESNVDMIVVDVTKPHNKRSSFNYYISYADFLALEKKYNDSYLISA